MWRNFNNFLINMVYCTGDYQFGKINYHFFIMIKNKDLDMNLSQLIFWNLQYTFHTHCSLREPGSRSFLEKWKHRFSSKFSSWISSCFPHRFPCLSLFFIFTPRKPGFAKYYSWIRVLFYFSSNTFIYRLFVCSKFSGASTFGPSLRSIRSVVISWRCFV